MITYEDVCKCIADNSNWRDSFGSKADADYSEFEAITHELAHVCSVEPESLVSEVFARNMSANQVAVLLRKKLPQTVEQDRNEYIVSAAVYKVSEHFGAAADDMEEIFYNLRNNLVLLPGSDKDVRIQQYCEQYFSHPEVKSLAARIISFYTKLVTETNN